MDTGKTTEKNIRIQTLLAPAVYRRLQQLRHQEDRSESKMAAILIEEALNARRTETN